MTTARLVLDQAIARLGAALLIAFLATVLPTVVHSLLTDGPMDALSDFTEVVRWIDIRPNGSF